MPTTPEPQADGPADAAAPAVAEATAAAPSPPPLADDADVVQVAARHARGEELARLVHTVGFAAADERRSRLDAGIEELAERLGIARTDADTMRGNVLDALRAVRPSAGERALIGALLSRGVALSPPEGGQAEARVVETLGWLAAHTALDAFPTLDATLGARAAGLWRAAADLVRRDGGQGGRAAAVVVTAHLVGSGNDAARAEATTLGAEVTDPALHAILAAPRTPLVAAGQATLRGEVVRAPRGPVVLFLLGITGLLVAYHALRLLARVLLRFRAPAELRVSPSGVTLISRTELLGRTLREREQHLPAGSLVRAAREVRYPSLPTYAGLAALALGSYFGLRLFTEGVLAGAPELLAIGAAAILLGVAIDFVIESAVAGAKGRCRVLLVPQRGPMIAVGDLDRSAADAALERLRGR
jgi:hypothetical protein